ncbi:MAG: peptidoglycan DD-metalloendopeptidase family protein [Candidatus Peregrinibacteria bacterium]
MLRIEISIPRPVETALIVLAFLAGALWVRWEMIPSRSVDELHAAPASADTENSLIPLRSGQALRDLAFPPNPSSPPDGGSGGPDAATQGMQLQDAVENARRIRSEQAVLERREEILRYQLNTLREEGRLSGALGSPTQILEEKTAEDALLGLMQNRQEAEQRFRETLQQMWEAEGISATLAVGSPGNISMLTWPVEPLRGLSATFLDPTYEARFGIQHFAIDIPTDQHTVIRAPADGIVEKVADNGMGYSYLMIRHPSASSGQSAGYVTVYGHVSAFLVKEGEHITQGDPIALSGGRPGSRGAGALTTGPHLHFEVLVNGKHVDPMTVLPKKSM